MPIQSIDPTTEEVLMTFEELTDEELEKKLALAAMAFETWRESALAERTRCMHRAAEYIRTNIDDLGQLMTLEMGKTQQAAKAELEKCAIACDYYADQASEFLAPRPTGIAATVSEVHFEPLGVVLAVMPWNFPFWQVIRFAAPALMAGNVGVLKHASNVPQCAEAIERIFREAGFPEGVFQDLRIGSARVERVVRDPRIVAVTLTGSEKAGIAVARVAGEELKKVVLELGGSDPFLVLEDADVAAAANVAAQARMQANAGQSCVAAKRFIVHHSIAEAFTEALRHEFTQLVIGNPSEPTTTFGPLSSASALKDIAHQVEVSVERGARAVCGGRRHGEKGYFYEPTILADVKKGMPAYDEEVFGPVAAIIEVSDDDEMIRVANDTPYGLGATIFTKDLERAKRISAKLHAGNVFVNSGVKSDVRAPFGGIKKSGHGRELSWYGMHEFLNIKHFFIA